jgi:hypothetical protein
MEALETDCPLHPAEVARILQVSISWLAKTRLSGTGPMYVKSVAVSAIRQLLCAISSRPEPGLRRADRRRNQKCEEARDHNLILALSRFVE